MSDIYMDLQSVTGLLREDKSAILIDARTPEEYATAHAAGAINVPIDALAIYAQDYIASGRKEPIITMCGSTGRGEKAEAILSENGVKGVKVMSGGLKAWKEAGLQVD